MHGSSLSLKEDVIPKISNPMNFFIFNAVVTSFAVIPGAFGDVRCRRGIHGAGFGTILIVLSAGTGGIISFFIARYAARPLVEAVTKAGGFKFSIKRSSETRGKSFCFSSVAVFTICDVVLLVNCGSVLAVLLVHVRGYCSG